MLKKSLMIASLAGVLATAGIATQASAADPALGALIGGGIGAAIGHDINGHHGAVAGGVLGAIVGSSIAAESNRYYYDDGYYAPAPAYYAPAAPVYYAPPPPVYYSPAYYGPAYYGPSVVIRSGPAYYDHHYRRHYSSWRDHRWH